MEVYVYYRVASTQVTHALQSLALAQAAALREWPNLRSRVLRKLSLNDADQTDTKATEPPIDVTFMEIYTSVDASLTPQCAAAVMSQLADEPPGRTSVRHVEYFDAPPFSGVPRPNTGPGG